VFGYLDEIKTGKSERFIQLDYYEKLKDQTMKFNGRIISFYDISYRSQPYEPNGCG
jgi:cell division septal protein FtsQ